ncbi:Uncharacterised protein [Mycolicibacterium vanbaalenii]|uniref:Integral membrane protein n=1 Tax=Mycolicibacterium vanbaalenii TaxID=110539 RepID=A0A5S9QY34_MYCVN|nr:hypothetical protein [Mycolicibacterium vanbaalenii]CAA0124284.1 Uncharacterised protein [Mycolicibacterium vanbaalenii]
MTYLARAHPLSTGLGLVMTVAAGIHTAGVTIILAILTGLAVLVGIRFRRAATLAVLLAAAAVMLTDAPPLATGLAGLASACYLTLRHNECESIRPAPGYSPAIVAALAFAALAVLAASLPLDIPWLPILAPPIMFLAYMMAIQPLRPIAIATELSHSDRI